MKSKVRILTLVGLLTGSLTGFAQDNPTPAATGSATAPAAAPSPATATKEAAPADEAPAATPAATPPAPAAETPAATPPAPAAEATPAPTAAAPAAASETPAANATVAPATAPAALAANDPAAPATTTNAAATPAPQPGTVIPLIVMDDVPLTDAIRNLARQAGLNYMLDPKIGFGQPDAAGHVVPQPSVSIRWEGITAEQALGALLANHSLQLVEDPKTKIARVTTKDPAAPPDLVTRVIQLKYSSPSNVVVAVQSALTDKRSKVVADIRTSQLVLLATEKELVDVEQMVTKLDTQTKQVLIEAKLLETSVNPTTKKGIDWTGTLDSQHFAIGNNPGGGVLANLAHGGAFTPAAAFLTADGVSATLSFLNTYAEAKTIASPRTVTLDNETAHISVTDVRPIINVTAGTANTTGGSSITYTNLGITLDVTPRISANNFVNLRVTPQVSRFTGQDKRTINSELFVVDLYAARSLDTRVMIPSGHTLVLGGLIQDEITLGNVKVPILGDIPGLSALFRQDTKTRKTSNLITFITPTIVQDEDYQLTPTSYLKTTPPASDLLEEKDWSAWDSGKPKDWKKKGGATKD